MRRGSRTIVILLVGYAVLILGFFAHQAFFVPQREVIASMMNAWDFLQAFIRVMAWAPALTATTILLLFGIMPDDPDTEGARRGHMAKLRGPLIAIGISSFVYAVVMAWAVPAAKAESARILSASRSFNAAIKSAEESIKAQDWKTAALQLSVARAIDDHDKRYLAQESLYNKRPAQREAPQTESGSLIGARAGQTATRYYEQALQAYKAGEWYLAHSLATLSHRIDPKREETQRLASMAWDKIAVQGDSEETTKQRAFARAKQEAYKALRAEDYIDAYDKFLQLSETAPKDPDVRRYLDESLEGVRKISFFQEEVSRLSLRPASAEVFFRMASRDGVDSFMAARTLYLGPEIVYARDFEYLVLKEGKPVLHVTSPFAKFQETVTTKPQATDAVPKPTAVPRETRILLAAYDAEDPPNGYLPEYKLGGDGLRVKSYQKSPIGLADLRAAVTATRDPTDLSALELFTSIRRARDFALDPRPFMREALDRVRVVLAFLILCLFSLLVGYRFRYHGKKPPVIELVIVAPMAWFASSLAFQAWEWLNGLWMDLSLSFAPAIAVVIFSLTQAASLALAFMLLAGHRDRPTD